MKGKIIGIKNCGSIVWITIRRLLFFRKKIPVENRMFWNMIDSRENMDVEMFWNAVDLWLLHNYYYYYYLFKYSQKILKS